jgi:hypothetical protein
MGFAMDGAGIDSYPAPGASASTYNCMTGYTTNAASGPALWQWTTIPTAGSHLFQPIWGRTGGTNTLLCATVSPVFFIVEELLKTNANNGTA